MKCLYCDSENFEKKNVRFNPEIRGEEIEVIALAFVCSKCQEPLMDAEQMNILRKTAADQYRRIHGAEDIKSSPV